MREMRTGILDMRDCCDSASTTLASLKGKDADVVVLQKWYATIDALKLAMQQFQDAETEAKVRVLEWCGWSFDRILKNARIHVTYYVCVHMQIPSKMQRD